MVTIYDSPGLQGLQSLQDAKYSESVEKRYLNDLKRTYKEVDLNLYCIRMNDIMQPSEDDAIKKLSKAIGKKEFWKKTMFVLTFANEVTPSKQSTSKNTSDYFKERMSKWEKCLQATIRKMEDEVAENILIVSAGSSDDQAANWLRELWFRLSEPIYDEKFNGYPEGNVCLRILVSGRTGAGKSALVNSIVGKCVAKESDGPCRATTKMTKYEMKLGDFKMNICRSFGVQDSDTNPCHLKMDIGSEYCASTKPSNAFGVQKWQETLFTLIFAKARWQETLFTLIFAKEDTPLEQRTSENIDKQMSEWEAHLQNTLKDERGITKKAAINVTIIPAYCSVKPAANDYWLSELWFKLLQPILPKTNSGWEATMIDCLQKRGKDGLHILVIGKSGTGKSALVNNMIGKKVAKEGDPPHAETTEVTEYVRLGNHIYDSPGLQDGADIDEGLKDKYKDVDLILYCIKMNDRIHADDEDAIKKLSRAFRKDGF